MKIPFFNQKPEYRAPQISPVPDDQGSKQNAVMINEQSRAFRIDIFDKGSPEDLVLALGTLEIAKDVIKQQLTQWHMKEAQRKAILVPRGNGVGHG